MYKRIEQSLVIEGLRILNYFQVSQDDSLPEIEGESGESVLLLIGNVGSSIWPSFIKSAEYQDNRPDPMDRWSKRIANNLSQQYGGYAVFPFDGPPYHPFVSWANKGNMSSISTLGLAIHSKYGLWHAYRFALVLPGSKLELPEINKRQNPCINCFQPCLSACPVNAFTGKGYRYLDCVKYLSQNADCECNSSGCASRRACPEAISYQYIPEQARFHMRVFVEAHSS